MKAALRKVGASVRERLLRLAHETGQPNSDLLDRYCIERWLHRLSCSRHRERFILKGAMLLIAWGGGVPQRVTRDADLLGFGDGSIASVTDAFREICSVEVPDDGVVFDLESVQGDSIRAQDEYAGVRVQLRATLAGAVVGIQVDVGFGDAVHPTELVFPSLLDFLRPRLRAYPRESSIAEKFEAICKLGMANSRMKDYFDIWHLSRLFEFDGPSVAHAIKATFERRGSPWPTGVPFGLSREFSGDRTKQTQWRAFWKKAVRRLPEPALPEVVEAVENFVMPAADAAKSGTTFAANWSPGGPWRQ